MSFKIKEFPKLKGRVISCTHQTSKHILEGKLVSAAQFEEFLKTDYKTKYGEEPLYATIESIHYTSERYGAINVSIFWEFLIDEVYVSSFTIDSPNYTHKPIPMAQNFRFERYEEENEY
ncbi:hypothetical protein [Ochrovirga pacifica]|uniref:hypothetical protein n=1 Tax=Ochrovirga pacifica TaxID=1042376 RepID=UPI0002557FB8|nr:hypothetical protein [Ochrovirga pacifica]